MRRQWIRVRLNAFTSPNRSKKSRAIADPALFVLPVCIILLVEFVELGAPQRHVGNEPLDVEDEGNDRIFAHG